MGPTCLHVNPGVIFGNVVYDSPSGTDTHVVILNDVHADIMDYIQPATCSESAFRTMWTEFEWENKVNINKKNAGTLREFLDQLMKSTNMSCLTPEAGLKGDCQFLSANLYAKSVFGKLINPESKSLGHKSTDNLGRRGRIGQPEHRKGGREWADHWFRADTKSFTRLSIKPGVAEGTESWGVVMSRFWRRKTAIDAVRLQKHVHEHRCRGSLDLRKQGRNFCSWLERLFTSESINSGRNDVSQ